MKIDCGVLLLKFLRQEAQRREVVFNILESGQRCLPVVRHRSLVIRPRLLSDGFAFAGIKKV